VLVVLADVPGATPSDIASVIEAAPERGVVICPSSAKGTGALFLRPPGVIPFRFGELSFQAHKREGAARRIEARVLHSDSLAKDIDEPDDLRRLLERPAETATHRLLAQLNVAARLG
jgi:2-phospho-L-lactate guanylyltransferase